MTNRERKKSEMRVQGGPNSHKEGGPHAVGDKCGNKVSR